jgi:hypothetical protein
MSVTRIADTKVYHVPDSLDDLRGPATGVLRLPLSLFWGPVHSFDIGDDGLAQIVYQAVINEGTKEDLSTYLNRNLLIDLWPRLSLPWRVYDLWESRFPELRR